MPSERSIASGRMERVTDYRDAIRTIRTADAKVDAVAFKAVMAGEKYRGTFLIDDALVAAMETFLPAAPAHNAIYLAAIRAFQEAMPGVPLVAAFEPEFHKTMPEYASRYGVPAVWRTEYGVRRYGFHGASHWCASERVPQILGVSKQGLRLVNCHLGGSSSMCAIRDGHSIDTTMGFSPQSGLENATRHGELDAFAVLYMMDRTGWTTEEIRRQLAKEGGLAGLSGIPGGDARDIEKAAAEGSEDARLALDVFTYQIKKNLGAYAAVMGGLDAISFTGGIGENSAPLREQCLAGLEFLGVKLSTEANRTGSGDRIVSTPDSKVTVVVFATNEEIIVARRAYRVLAA
ncbi:MAG: acetate/propionate family kinase [Acidobacteriales bacterium]|nr:acetate/propionate family kinase [Terriglobales bacterium]